VCRRGIAAKNRAVVVPLRPPKRNGQRLISQSSEMPPASVVNAGGSNGVLNRYGETAPLRSRLGNWRVDFARFTTLSFCQSEIPKTVKHPFQ
jgi:hypothetical protein